MTQTSQTPTSPSPSDSPVRRALFAGSFNPFTIGHLSVVERALPMFADGIIIAVGINAAKALPDPSGLDARLDAIRRAVRHLPGVTVTSYTDLTAHAARRLGATVLLRGVRSVTDFEYERSIADINRRLTGIETILLYTLPEHAAISSSILRDLRAHGEDITPYLP